MASKRVPKAAILCALIATLNAVSWSLLTPPFQVPDEPDHLAYVKQLSETGHLPADSQPNHISLEELYAFEGTRYFNVRQQPENHTIASQEEQWTLENDLAAVPADSPPGSLSAGVATSQPPLYYLLEAIPYSLARGGNLLERLQLMRLLSAMMAGITAMFVFLFLRETMPRVSWAWVTGALCVALVPLSGFMSGAVNPDAMLFAISAALFYTLARFYG